MTSLIAELEDDVLEMLLDGNDAILEALREQLRVARRQPREMTGAGFFTDFDMPSGAARIPGNPSFSFGDVNAEIEGLQFGAGFVLHVREGFLALLEGYSYEEPWPKTITRYKLSYGDQTTRDWAALRATPGWPNRSHGA